MLIARGRRFKIDLTAIGLRRAALLAALFYLGVAQALSAAHASSVEGMAPDHDQAACVFHLAGDRAADALAPEAVFLPVVFENDEPPVAAAPVVTPRRQTADPPVRAPPAA